MFENFKKYGCPIDKKRCDAEIHRYMRQHEYSDGEDWGVCRYGQFGEHEGGYTPPNCESKNPIKKPVIVDITRSELTDLRTHGFHDLANRKTVTINPKKDLYLPKSKKYSEGDYYPINTRIRNNDFDKSEVVEIRKKKTSSKPKRKPVKCSCKKK
jgi:hypothetical protein